MDNRDFVLAPHHIDDTMSTYNFPVSSNLLRQDFDIAPQMSSSLDYVYNANQEQAFRVNIAFGYVLVHNETGQLRYFVAHQNWLYLDHPRRIDRPSDMNELQQELDNSSILEHIMNQRCDTKWKPLLITNILVYVYHLGITMGRGNLPDFIQQSRSIVSLDKEPIRQIPYNDDLCAVRALAYHNNVTAGLPGYSNLEEKTLLLQKRWNRAGLELSETDHFEDTFDIAIDIYTMCEDGSVVPRYLSTRSQENVMTLNLHDQHLSYVVNRKSYLKKFQCASCKRHFDHMGTWQRHQGNCTNATKNVFPGGFQKANKTIFQELEEYGITVPVKDQTYPFFAVFDCEAMLIPNLQDKDDTGKLHWKEEHKPISVSICSNLEGFNEPKCFVDPVPENLVTSMMDYLRSISKDAYTAALDRWENAITELDEKIDYWTKRRASTEADNENDNDEADDEQEDPKTKENNIISQLLTLKGKFEGYCQQLPVLGFNSSRYDLNLLKSFIVHHLQLDSDPLAHVIKKRNSYQCISTENLKFLDMSNFVSAGHSYASFLKSFRVETSKSFFPYEFLDSPEKLQYPSIPPYDAFFSHLKQKNVLEEDGGVARGLENYKKIEEIWKSQDMTCLKDWLVYYNNLDVGPFVEAVSKYQAIFFSRHIDAFKVAVSAPGIARQWMFHAGRKAGASFALIDRRDEDLFNTIKQNIVGGPSIVFSRYHEAGKTHLWNEEDNVCESIEGFDANALYLWSIGQNMPSGSYVRRHTPNFPPIARTSCESMFHWMDFLQRDGSCTILHARNYKEKRIGPYRVDGYDPNTDTVYEFNGCWYHGCACMMRDNLKEDTRKLLQERKERTHKREEFLRHHAAHIKIMKECDFNKEVKQNQVLQEFIDQRVPEFYRHHKQSVTEEQILQAVCQQTLFGLVEVDIHVPEDKWEMFKEISPIFCTSLIKPEQFGDHMKQHVVKEQLSERPRKLLVGGMRATKIYVASELLKWYLEHGLKVTHIYQVIEYTPKRCFKEFMEEVSDARRAGSKDPILADTMKLLGNSGYGSMIMDKTKHTDVIYVRGHGNAQMKMNDPKFKHCQRIDDIIEIEMAKKRIIFDLPIQIGYIILQYAKLRMLAFHYDFLVRYCQPKKFQHIEMDTDSYYLALAGENLRDVMHPDMKIKFDEQVLHQCHRENHKADESTFFPRQCCEKHKDYDKRTPGLFKLEAKGEGIIALCSKTYVLKKPDGTCKLSCKGLNKNALDDPYALYKQVLETKVPASGVNRGIRARMNTVYTYEQERQAISYFYCKRKLLQDGINTEPLTMSLSPWP